jgi:hypothetical protein
MSFDPASSMLYVLLIISGVALFLCILNLLSLRELSGRIRQARDESRRPEQDTQTLFYPDRSGSQEKEADPGKSDDIISGIGLIAQKYRLDSLIIASRDGLVVASSGSRDPEFEAAYYTDLLSRKSAIPDDGVRLFEFVYKGMDFIGIIRGKNLCPDGSEQLIKADIQTVFDSLLGKNSGISGEII